MSWTPLYFEIDGTKSNTIGVNGCYLIRTESEVSRQIIGNKSIVENKIKNYDIPFFQGTNKEPIEYNLKFSLMNTTFDDFDDFDDTALLELGKLFGLDKYSEFKFYDDAFTSTPTKVFYPICTSINLITYGELKGWINVHMRTSAPYVFSPETTTVYDCSAATAATPVTIEITNISNVSDKNGNYYYYPEVWVELLNSQTGFTLRNTSDSDRETTFSSCDANDTIYLNNALKQVSATDTSSIFSKFASSHNWFRLVYNTNSIEVTNSCNLTIKTKYPIYC